MIAFTENMAHASPPGASIYEKTENRLRQLRRECESLQRYFADSETETATHMMTGLDMFTNGFLQLTKLIEDQSGTQTRENNVFYIE